MALDNLLGDAVVDVGDMIGGCVTEGMETGEGETEIVEEFSGKKFEESESKR